MRSNPACLATLIVSLLALCQARPADAAARKKTQPHAHHYTSETSMRANSPAANGYTGYYERVLDRVPYGSQLWWRVYHSYPRN
jgi:hypothetical protein